MSEKKTVAFWNSLSKTPTGLSCYAIHQAFYNYADGAASPASSTRFSPK